MATARDMITAILEPASMSRRSAKSAEFVRGLTTTILNRAAAGQRMSDRQKETLVKLFIEVTTPRPAPVNLGAGIDGVRALFNTALGNGLARPRIKVTVDGITITLKMGQGKHEGSIFAGIDRDSFGKISPNGDFYRYRTATDEQVAALRAFGDDPAGCASRHGLTQHNCCFCCQDLTDPRSQHVGYGQTCAGNYGLPWGEDGSVPQPGKAKRAGKVSKRSAASAAFVRDLTASGHYGAEA
jgi:hypothetical protein